MQTKSDNVQSLQTWNEIIYLKREIMILFAQNFLLKILDKDTRN